MRYLGHEVGRGNVELLQRVFLGEALLVPLELARRGIHVQCLLDSELEGRQWYFNIFP